LIPWWFNNQFEINPQPEPRTPGKPFYTYLKFKVLKYLLSHLLIDIFPNVFLNPTQIIYDQHYYQYNILLSPIGNLYSSPYKVQSARNNLKQRTAAVVQIIISYYTGYRRRVVARHRDRWRRDGGGDLPSARRRINSGTARGWTMLRVEIIISCPPPTGSR